MLAVIALDSATLECMGEKARQHVVSFFDRKEHLLRMLDFYKEELNG